MAVIDGDAPWIVELAWLGASLAEHGHEREALLFVAREHLHSVIIGVDEKQQASMMVEHQAARPRQHSIVVSWLDVTNRELDSSIDVIMARLVEMVGHA